MMEHRPEVDADADAIRKALLDRPAARGLIDQNPGIGTGIATLGRIVDEGIGLLVKINQHGHVMDTVDRVTIAHLFVHGVSMLDGIHTLLERGQTYAAVPCARSFLESFVFLIWILGGDSETRSNQYVVGYHRKMKRRIERSVASGDSDPSLVEDIKRREKILSRPTYAATNAAFIEHISRSKGNWDPNWYALNKGPQNFSELIAQTPLPDQVRLFWRVYSEHTHASTLEEHTASESDGLRIDPIRTLESINQICIFVGYLAFYAFEAVCDRALPSHKLHVVRRFKRWLPNIKNMPIVTIRRA
jgi:uncharacterized protein DUF5677